MKETIDNKTNLLEIIPQLFGSLETFLDRATQASESREWFEGHKMDYVNTTFRDVAETLCRDEIAGIGNLNYGDFDKKIVQVYPGKKENFYKEALEISLNNDWHVNNFPNNSLFDAQYFLYQKYLNKSKTQN